MEMKRNTLTIMVASSLLVLVHGAALAQPTEPRSSRCLAFAGLRGGFSAEAFELSSEYSGTVCGDPMTSEWHIIARYQTTGPGSRSFQFTIRSTPDAQGLLSLGNERVAVEPEIRVLGGASPRVQLTQRINPLPGVPGARVTPRPLAWVSLERSTQCVCKPSPCDAETGFTFDRWRNDRELREDVGRILELSQTWKSIYNELKPAITRGAGAEQPSDTLGLTGRRPDGSGYAIWLNFPRMTSRFQIANVMAHEYGHVQSLQRRGFSLSEAAPFLTTSEYLTVRWNEEQSAIETEFKILREIRAAAAADPDLADLAACIASAFLNDPSLQALAENDRTALRATVRERYPRNRIEEQYEGARRGERDPQIRTAVEAFRRSSEWPKPSDWLTTPQPER